MCDFFIRGYGSSLMYGYFTREQSSLLGCMVTLLWIIGVIAHLGLKVSDCRVREFDCLTRDYRHGSPIKESDCLTSA